MRRGQGSLEQLLMVAAVILIGVVVVVVANSIVNVPAEATVAQEDKYDLALAGFELVSYEVPFNAASADTLPGRLVRGDLDYVYASGSIPDGAEPVGKLTDSSGKSHTIWVWDSPSGGSYNIDPPISEEDDETDEDEEDGGLPSDSMMDQVAAMLAPSCSSDDDCELGYECAGDVCTWKEPECTSDDECKPEELCIGGECIVGDCKQGSNCEGEEDCVAYMCTEVECESDDECLSAQRCVGYKCLDVDCSDDSNCTSMQKCAGFKCKEESDLECEDDSDCLDNETCMGYMCVAHCGNGVLDEEKGENCETCPVDAACAAPKFCSEGECVKCVDECTNDNECYDYSYGMFGDWEAPQWFFAEDCSCTWDYDSSGKLYFTFGEEGESGPGCEKRCNGLSFEICADWDGDGCTEWGQEEMCGDGSCEGGLISGCVGGNSFGYSGDTCQEIVVSGYIEDEETEEQIWKEDLVLDAFCDGADCDGCATDHTDGVCEGSKGENCGNAPLDCKCNPTYEKCERGKCVGWCGNGRLDPGEHCEGNDFRVEGCTDVYDAAMKKNYDGGTLKCNNNCGLHVAGCYSEGVCNDGVVGLGEECEPPNSLTCDSNCMNKNYCGDGVKGSAEYCDGADFGGRTCANLGSTRGTLKCTSGCMYDYSECIKCGNNRIEEGEQCDWSVQEGHFRYRFNSDTNGKCTELNSRVYSGGDLKCKIADCRLDANDCHYCGDGVREGVEECDDGAENRVDSLPDSCSIYCKYRPPAQCGDGITQWDAGEECDDGNTDNRDVCVNCKNAYCGDGVAQYRPTIIEKCDGTDLAGFSCDSPWSALGHLGGSLKCGSDCKFDKSGCYDQLCGDGRIDGTEKCDGSNLNSNDCVSLGFTSGTLKCSSCAFDTGACEYGTKKINETCAKDLDCESSYCVNSKCKESACTDGVENGDESDIDCGGSCTAKCATGKKCSGTSDCAAGDCIGFVCGYDEGGKDVKITNVKFTKQDDPNTVYSTIQYGQPVDMHFTVEYTQKSAADANLSTVILFHGGKAPNKVDLADSIGAVYLAAPQQHKFSASEDYSEDFSLPWVVVPYYVDADTNGICANILLRNEDTDEQLIFKDQCLELPYEDKSGAYDIEDTFSFKNWGASPEERDLIDTVMEGAIKQCDIPRPLIILGIVTKYVEESGMCTGVATTSIRYHRYLDVKPVDKENFEMDLLEDEGVYGDIYKNFAKAIFALGNLIDSKLADEILSRKTIMQNMYDEVKLHGDDGLLAVIAIPVWTDGEWKPVDHAMVLFDVYDVSTDEKNFVIYDVNHPNDMWIYNGNLATGDARYSHPQLGMPVSHWAAVTDDGMMEPKGVYWDVEVSPCTLEETSELIEELLDAGVDVAAGLASDAKDTTEDVAKKIVGLIF